MHKLGRNTYLEYMKLDKIFTVDDPCVYGLFPVTFPQKWINIFLVFITDVRSSFFQQSVIVGRLCYTFAMAMLTSQNRAVSTLPQKHDLLSIIAYYS